MRAAVVMALFTLLSVPAQGVVEVTVPCTLAERIDFQSFTLLSDASNELELDQAALAYSACLAQSLDRDLKRQPQLAARLSRLRELYAQLGQAEGRLTYAVAGGGTLYIHNVARAQPNTERTLRTLAALASSPYGGQTGKQFSQSVSFSRQAFLSRVAALEAWRPRDPALFSYDPATFRADAAQYEQAGRAIMGVLGSREDAATAAGYQPLAFTADLDEFLTDRADRP